MWARVEQVAGALIMAAVLADVFTTVLYARISRYVSSAWLGDCVWWAVHRIDRWVHPRKELLIGFAGPLTLVFVLLLWTVGLAVGSGLLMHPALGNGIAFTRGQTPTDFVSAFYAAGISLALTGSTDFEPQTTAWRLLFWFNSLAGVSVVTLTLTYFMQVYSALQRRNTFGLKLWIASGETGDAGELLARLSQGGRLERLDQKLIEISVEMVGVNESHHFYPVLFYFRFREPFYAVAFTTSLSLDLVSILDSALDEEHADMFRGSVSLEELRLSASLLLELLEETFEGGAPEPRPPSPEQAERWKARFRAALPRLRQARFPVRPDVEGGAERYVHLRSQWDRAVEALVEEAGRKRAKLDASEPRGDGDSPHAGPRMPGSSPEQRRTPR